MNVLNDLLENRIEGTIKAKNITIGKGVTVEAGALITGKDGPADNVVLGDFCYIGTGTKILTPEFMLGDYSKLHAASFCHGVYPLRIGRNCWIGGNTVLDSMGGLDIDDNVGIGSHSQVWTHIQFGDIVEGCRFHSHKYMHLKKDTWLVGHCIMNPVETGEKSMALAGSVITRDMLPNHVYAGVPAVDITDSFGPQFEKRSIEEKAEKLNALINDFYITNPAYKGKLRVITGSKEIIAGTTCFNVSDRTYTKLYSEAEIVFLKNNVPLVKFIPMLEPDFITTKNSSAGQL